MTPPTQLSALPRTSRSGEVTDTTRALQHAMMSQSAAEAMRLVRNGADPHLEAFVHEMNNGDEFEGLTLMAQAVLFDCEHDRVYMVPALHRAGGRLDIVDGVGRTLLHFAFSAPVARYLISNGVPLPEGARERLERALARTPGAVLFDDNVALAYPDRAGIFPWIAGRLRAAGFDERPWRDVVAVTADSVARLVRPALVQELAAMDDEWISGRFVARLRPDGADLASTVVLFSVLDELGDALVSRDVSRARSLIDVGAELAVRRFDLAPGGAEVGTRWYQALSAPGLATVLDAADNEVNLLRIFDRWVLDGAHDDDGSTLLHLARSPVVCGWLVEQGLRPDAVDNFGRIASEVLPPELASLLEAARQCPDESPAATCDGASIGRD